MFFKNKSNKSYFSLVYSFLYSPRSGTPAAERVEQFVPDDVKSERFARLLSLQDEVTWSSPCLYLTSGAMMPCMWAVGEAEDEREKSN